MWMELFDNVGKEFPVELEVLDGSGSAVLNVKLRMA